MEKLFAAYLRQRGYMVWKRLPRPKVGDTIEYLAGGAWDIYDFYTQTATVVARKNKLSEYGYLSVEKRKGDKLIVATMVEPRSVIRVIPQDKP